MSRGEGADTRYTSNDERWEPVVGRDRRADGVFILAVRTTGIYCHPSCRARLSNRVNARFFETAEAASYGSGSRFYAAAGETLGMTPSTYRSGAAGERIRFSIVPCSLGLVMVAATERGLCAVELGEDAAALRAALRRRFPRADLTEDAPGFAEWVTETVAFIEAPARGLSLPLDIRGTAFQRVVWAALREIARARLSRTPRWRRGWAGPRPPARLRGPVPPTIWRWWYPATEWCVRTAR